MEHNVEKNREETKETKVQEQAEEQAYSDPNENVKDPDVLGEGAGYQYSYMQNPSNYAQQYTYYNGREFQDTGYQQGPEFQNTNYQQGGQFRNTNYQQGGQFQNTNYQKGQEFQNTNYQQGQQSQQYYAVYQQQDYAGRQMDDTSPMSMGDWLLIILASFLPCAGVILYFVWAFGSHGNVNRRNYCRAMLIVMGGLLVIYILIFMVTGVIGTGYYCY